MLLSKKSKDLIPTQAQKEGIPEEDLQDMVNAYWKTIRDTLEKLGYEEGEAHLAVYVEGFGTFRMIKHRVLNALPQVEKAYKKFKSPKRKETIKMYKDILKAFDQEYENRVQYMEEKLLYKQGYEIDNEPVEVDGKLQYNIPGHNRPDKKPSESTYRMGCGCRACKNAFAIAQKRRMITRKLKEDGTKGHTTEGMGEQG